MSETLMRLQKNHPGEQGEKYFSFQIRGWTNFDPMNKTLARIAAGIEESNGFLTVVEVLRVEDNLSAIGDEEARECFANTLAAKRLLRNVHELPKKLVEDLRSALKNGEVVPDKSDTPEPISLVRDEPISHAKPWL